MVKGISRQVIVVEGPEPKLFDQAIFILKEDMGEGITDEALLREAQRAIQSGAHSGRKRLHLAVRSLLGRRRRTGNGSCMADDRLHLTCAVSPIVV